MTWGRVFQSLAACTEPPDEERFLAEGAIRPTMLTMRNKKLNKKKNVFQCVFEVDRDKGLTLTELADGVTVEDVVQHTGCEFKVSADLKKMGDVTQRETITI